MTCSTIDLDLHEPKNIRNVTRFMISVIYRGVIDNMSELGYPKYT